VEKLGSWFYIINSHLESYSAEYNIAKQENISDAPTVSRL
jgi:hypothetical protein